MSVTIQIPDDLARGLEKIAAAQQKTVEQLAEERLRPLLGPPTSPGIVLRAIQSLAHPSPEAMDELDSAIRAASLPVRNHGVFDR